MASPRSSLRSLWENFKHLFTRSKPEVELPEINSNPPIGDTKERRLEEENKMNNTQIFDILLKAESNSSKRELTKEKSKVMTMAETALALAILNKGTQEIQAQAETLKEEKDLLADEESLKREQVQATELLQMVQRKASDLQNTIKKTLENPYDVGVTVGSREDSPEFNLSDFIDFDRVTEESRDGKTVIKFHGHEVIDLNINLGSGAFGNVSSVESNQNQLVEGKIEKKKLALKTANLYREVEGSNGIKYACPLSDKEMLEIINEAKIADELANAAKNSNLHIDDQLLIPLMSGIKETKVGDQTCYQVCHLMPIQHNLKWYTEKLNDKKIPDAAIHEGFVSLIRQMQVMHENNIFHYDIKPDNILFTNNLKFKLVDFGCARQLKDGELHEVSRKTDFNYMPPYTFELYNSNKTNPDFQKAIDEYRMGLTLMFLLKPGLEDKYKEKLAAICDKEGVKNMSEFHATVKLDRKIELIEGVINDLYKEVEEAYQNKGYDNELKLIHEMIYSNLREPKPVLTNSEPFSQMSKQVDAARAAKTGVKTEELITSKEKMIADKGSKGKAIKEFMHKMERKIQSKLFNVGRVPKKQSNQANTQSVTSKTFGKH